VIASQVFDIEFGGGWEGACRAYYKALTPNHFHNFGMMNFVNKSGIKRVVLLYNEPEEL
jgi:hypothetical protein